MFNPIHRIPLKSLLAPIVAGAVLLSVGSVPARSQPVMLRRVPSGQLVPTSPSGTYIYSRPTLNGVPIDPYTGQPITFPSNTRTSSYRGIAPSRRVVRRAVLSSTVHPSSSGTTILINPTIVVPYGHYRTGYYRGDRYYRDYRGDRYAPRQGSYIYYGSPNGLQIQFGY